MLKDLFLLDPQVIFLNHGSFGACPKPVFEVYQAWQVKLECQPVQFLGVELDDFLHAAREALGRYLNAPTSDIAFIPNATYGVNIVARSLKLKPGDEILSTDQEYGACNYTWEFICNKSSAIYKQLPVSTPVTSSGDILDQIWQGVTPRTKVIFLSHITSPTSITLPIRQICQRAREIGILTVIDGAHAPGQIHLDLTALQADFYIGNCHKWMLSPKGAGFLYAHPKVQNLIEPLIVSWGYQSLVSAPKESVFIDLLQWMGTKDPSAALTVPNAIDFMRTYHWDDVRADCHHKLSDAMQTTCEFTGLPPIYPVNSDLYQQMGTLPIPRIKDINILKSRLYKDYKIEIPCIEWKNQHFLRLSVQGYNTAQDIDQFLNALKVLIPELKE